MTDKFLTPPLFTPAQRTSAYESIVEQIEQAVRDGHLKAGDRLPGERQLMTDFGVSRTTVREALKVLQATGTISSRPGDPRGPVITTYSPRLLEKSMKRFATLDSVSRVELLQFRLTLESAACRLAAELHTDDELADILEAKQSLVAAASEADGRFGAAVNEFHSSIRRAAHNQIIEVCGNVVGGIMGEMIDARLIGDEERPRRVRRSAEAAAELVAAIRERRAADAAAIVKRNIYEYYAEDLSDEEIRGVRGLVDELSLADSDD